MGTPAGPTARRLRRAAPTVAAAGAALVVLLGALTFVAAGALRQAGTDLGTTGAARLAALDELVEARGEVSLAQAEMDGIVATFGSHVADSEVFEPWYRHTEKAAAALREYPGRLPRDERVAAERGTAAAEAALLDWRGTAEGLAGSLISPGTPPQVVTDAIASMREKYETTFAAIEKLRGAQAAATSRRAAEEAAAAETAGSRVLLAGVAVAMVVAVVTVVRWRTTRREARLAEDYQRRQAVEVRRNELEARLQRGLEMAQSEEESYRLVRRVLTDVVPDARAEVLVADSSRTHLDQVVVTGDDDGPIRCGVRSPGDCPAARRGQTLAFPDSAAVDACPHLSGPGVPTCSAVCIPMSMAGTTVGVLRAVGDQGVRLPDPVVKDLEMVAQKASERVGIIRAFAQSQSQARTDPLTGLLNRRSLEERIQLLDKAGTAYAVAFGDLDHFKRLNDLHGHETGDRALRLFSRVLTEHTRPGDVVCRFGGEEFVVLMPDCALDDAQAVLGRVQDALRRELGGGTLPTFTVSFGLVAADGTRDFAQLAAAADAALLEAKRQGRDRILRAA